MRTFVIVSACLLTACQQQSEAQPDTQPKTQPNTQRIALAEVKPTPRATAMESPETGSATWTVAESGKAINFANIDAAPLLTLDCRLDEEPAQIAIIRHAPAFPGQGALLAVMGNGHASRLLADAVLKDGEWRWESILNASDPQLDLFIGPGEMRATLPGKGAIAIPPSRIPGEFVEWCRAGGETVGAPVLREEPAEAGPAVPGPAEPEPTEPSSAVPAE